MAAERVAPDEIDADLCEDHRTVRLTAERADGVIITSSFELAGDAPALPGAADDSSCTA
jgi:hypothetical protein